MPRLNESNSSIDKNSGAVMFHCSPELKELKQLKQEISKLNNKIDTLTELVIELLKGGKSDC